MAPDQGTGAPHASSGEIEFYIPATSSLFERRPRTLKHGDTFAMFDHYGDIFTGERTPEGIFHEDTRHLSRYQLSLNGHRPLLLSSNVQDNNAVLAVNLTNPDMFEEDGRLGLHKDSIHILRSRFLWQSACYERLAFHNFDAAAHRLAVEVKFDADFVDLFHVRGHPRTRHGDILASMRNGDTVLFEYRGLDGVVRHTLLQFSPPPADLALREALFHLQLAPGQRQQLFVTIRFGEACAPSRPVHFLSALKQARRPLRGSAARSAAVHTSNEIFNEILSRSRADICMLVTDTPHGAYPYAGIPWFSTAFGRDGLLTAVQMLWADPEIAKGVLRFLAATQATEDDAKADAEPGKVLHETRRGELARLGEIPFGKYYGSVDATPLFVVLAGLYWQRTGDIETIRELWPHLEAALAWIDGCSDGDGLVAYKGRVEGGLVNQGWKDSQDAVFHADGQLAAPPIALCEVQGYVHLAKRLAAQLARRLDHPARASILDEQAQRLRERIEQVFWCDDLQTYALALDGGKRPCLVRASNAGHLLWTGVPSRERAERLAEHLLGAAMFSGWGVRTVAAGEARYNPVSYHNGSVWPHDNAVIALGLARYGLKDATLRILNGIIEAAGSMDLRRLPELFCGFKKQPGQGPTLYPVACAPQAWASATPFALLQAALGLELDAAANAVRFHRPRLPTSLDEVVIRGLRLGDSRMDLLLRRHGADVAVNVLRREGDAGLVVTL